MIVRVDKTGHHQPIARVDDVLYAFARKVGTDRNDVAVFDQNVGH